VHESLQASTVSPAHATVPELLAPLSLPPELASPLDEAPDEDEPGPTTGSSPTHAPRATKTRSKPVAMPRTERIRSSYH